MPAGALWQLHYADDVDSRIQARSDRQRFAQDRNVLTATLRRDASRIFLDVQLIDDTNNTFDESLRILYEDNGYEETVSEYQGQLYQPEPNPRPQVPPDIRERIISEYISTASGRRALAASMVQPIRRPMDYASIARRTFIVEQLPEGALPNYDQPPKFDPPAWVKFGTWVKEDDTYAMILALESPEGFPVVEYQVWRDYGPPLKMVAKSFCDRWLPSEPPPEPRTRFERILLDDD
jgi:hypothetical protein